MRVLLDENLPPFLGDVLRILEHEVWLVRDEMMGAADTTWLAGAAELRAIVFTRDGKIKKVSAERAAVVAHGLTVFVFRKEASLFELMRCLLNRLPDIEAAAETPHTGGRFFLVKDRSVTRL